jgi:hypothetical protein
MSVSQEHLYRLIRAGAFPALRMRLGQKGRYVLPARAVGALIDAATDVHSLVGIEAPTPVLRAGDQSTPGSDPSPHRVDRRLALLRLYCPHGGWPELMGVGATFAARRRVGGATIARVGSPCAPLVRAPHGGMVLPHGDGLGVASRFAVRRKMLILRPNLRNQNPASMDDPHRRGGHPWRVLVCCSVVANRGRHCSGGRVGVGRGGVPVASDAWEPSSRRVPGLISLT